MRHKEWRLGYRLQDIDFADEVCLLAHITDDNRKLSHIDLKNMSVHLDYKDVVEVNQFCWSKATCKRMFVG